MPTIVRWPAVLEGGQVTSEPLDTMDWTATLLAAAGGEPHPDYPLDGTNLLGWLESGEWVPHDLRWRTRRQGALRRGKWKLLHDRRAKLLWSDEGHVEGSRTRLFDLSVDGREWADLSHDHPDVAAELLGEWRAFDEAMLPYEELTADPGPGEAD